MEKIDLLAKALQKHAKIKEPHQRMHKAAEEVMLLVREDHTFRPILGHQYAILLDNIILSDGDTIKRNNKAKRFSYQAAIENVMNPNRQLSQDQVTGMLRLKSRLDDQTDEWDFPNDTEPNIEWQPEVFQDFLILSRDTDQTPLQVLMHSGDFNKKQLKMQHDIAQNRQVGCRILLGGHYVFSVWEVNKKKAIASAAQHALERLKRYCFHVEMESSTDSKYKIGQHWNATKLVNHLKAHGGKNDRFILHFPNQGPMPTYSEPGGSIQKTSKFNQMFGKPQTHQQKQLEQQQTGKLTHN